MESPKVFASYSHDSDEHKEWVLKLCTKLREYGVDATLDEWDLNPGDLMLPFMREGISDSDRVLVICTDRYVQRANALEGGVGYEITIVDSELDQDLRTNKFIPIIRQSTGKPKTPLALGIRSYIDFRNDQDFEQKFDELLCAIHGESRHPKPPLGENPFSKQSPEVKVSNHFLPEIPETVESASDAYNLAIQLARADDTLGWQELVERIRPRVLNSLRQLRQEHSQSGNLENAQQRIEVVDKAVDIISPLISVALAGVKSQNEHFNNQTSILESLRSIDGWNRNSGDEYHIGIPNFLGYVYQSLHGSISLNTNQLPLALDLARFKVPIVRSPQSQHNMVWKITMLMGWSQALNQKCTENWQYLANAYERWKWLRDVFEDNSTYLTSLVAYYMALSIHELAAEIADGREIGSNPYNSVNVPFDFLTKKYEIKQRATSLLRSDPTLSELWTSVGVTQDQMRDSWEAWIKLYENLFWHFNQGRNFLAFVTSPPQYLNFFDAL